jgi:hypothetical protein
MISKLVSKDENNSIYNIIKGNQLLFYNKENNSFTVHGDLLEIFSKFEKIIKSRTALKLFKWFIKNKAATGSYLCDHYRYDHNVYRDINLLKNMGLIEAYMKVKSKEGGGPKPVLYGLPGLDSKFIAETVIMIQTKNKASYRLVSDLVQITLDEVKEQEINFRKIVEIIKPRCKGYHFLDLTEMVAIELQTRYGVTVWR